MSVQERTVRAALHRMAEALYFYAERSHWNDDYPGGIDCENGSLDFGHEAQQALRNQRVRRVLEVYAVPAAPSVKEKVTS